MNIYRSLELDIHNLISIRSFFYSHDYYKDIFVNKERIANYIDDSEKFMVTIYHSFNNNFQSPKYDIEVMYKAISNNIPREGKWIERLHLKDAICLELIDEQDMLQKGIQELNELALKMELAIGRNIWVQYYKQNKLYIYLYAEKRMKNDDC